MTLVIHPATSTEVPFAVDTDDPAHATPVSRITVGTTREHLRRHGLDHVRLCGWNVTEDDLTALLRAMDDAYDVRMETLHERAADFDSNFRDAS